MNKIRFTSEYIEVVCDRTDTDTQTKLINIYPITANRIKTNYRMSPHLAPEILKLLRNIDASNIDTAPLTVQQYYFKEISIRNNIQDLLTNGPRESCYVSDRLTLDTHQQLGREIAMYQNKFAFFYDTRTGKTPMSLTIIKDNLVDNPQHRWLVVCPLILIYNAWLEDSAKFYPEITTINCHADTPAKRMAAMAQQGNIYLTNTESFIKYKPYFDQMNFYGCFVDESSDMKSNKSQISADLVNFALTMKRFYLLSGTPAPNGQHEYYMQMRAVDYYGWQPSYTQFKQYYFVNLSFNPQYEKLALRPDRQEELYATIKKTAMFVDKADVLDLPGREFIPIEYDMPKELMGHYRQLKNELYVELGDNLRITAPSTGAKLNKLNQVSSGFIMDTQARKENKFYGEDPTYEVQKEWYLLDDFRFTAMLDFLTSEKVSGEQVIIWANYRKEFEVIKSLLRDQCDCIYGGTSISAKNDAIRRFKEGSIRYLVANPASADKGLTLTNCHIALYFSLNWSYELFKQSYDRIYGSIKIQPKFCKYYIMIAKGTIDAVLYHDVLQGKSDSSYAVLNHLKPEVIANES